MLSSHFATMTDEQFNVLPNSTNAVESHNRLSKLSQPEILNAAMLTTYVTGFVKRGLPHTSDLQVSIIHNLRCVKAMDLEIVQFRPLA